MVEVDAVRRDVASTSSRSAIVPWPSCRGAGDGLRPWSTRRDRRPMTPEKMRFVAVAAGARGPSDRRGRRCRAERADRRDAQAARARARAAAAARSPKSMDFSAGARPPSCPSRLRRPNPGPPCGRGAPGVGVRRVTRRSCSRCLLLGRAGRARSRGRSRWSSISSSWVPRPTIRPASRTTIWSAWRMVLTRWATMITVASAVSGASAARSARVGGVVERRERVVEQVDLRLVHERPGDGEALALTAGDVGAALGDRGVEAVGHRARRSRGPGRSRAPATAPRRWRRVAVAQVAWRPCRRTGTAAAAPGRSPPTARPRPDRGRRRRRS